MRAAAAELDKTRFEYLEEKLRARDAQLAALRRDRNALLSSLRQLQQQQQQQVVAEVVAEPPTPTPPPQAEPPATPTPIPTPMPTVDAVDAAVARTPEAAAAFVSPIARLPRAILKEVAPPGSARTGGGDAAAARPRAAVSAGLLDELQALSSELLAPLGGVA